MKIDPVPTPQDIRDAKERTESDLGRALARRIAHRMAGSEVAPGYSYTPVFQILTPYPAEVLRRAEDLLGHNGWGKVEIKQHVDDALRLCVLLEVPQ